MEVAKNLWMYSTAQYQISDLSTWEDDRNIAQGESW